MEDLVAVSSFRSPQESLGALDAGQAALLIEGMADIAIVLDMQGIIKDIAFCCDDLLSEFRELWIGQSWLDTVSPDNRATLQALLQEASGEALTRWRQVSHPTERGADIPIQYRLARLGDQGGLIALGRNLQGMAALQQQLVDAQQALERDYWRFRQVETRYRLLFRMVSEAILIIDASTQRVVEANPAAGQLLGETPTRIIGRPFPDGFDADGTQAINALLAGVRAAGRADDVRARLTESTQEFLVSALLLRQESLSFLLVRLSPLLSEASTTALPETNIRYLRALEQAPDGIVITDAEGRILSANSTFLNLTEIAAEQQARGESLDHWLGRPGVDLSVLMANLRQHETVRLFATTLRGEYGSVTEVEISAAAIQHGERPCFGFFIRDIGRRLGTEQPPTPEQPRWLAQLTERVGRVPLKELVRESTDTIERLCIEAALKLTGDNRASAAELLGLSRQSLYVKIDRYGIADQTHAPATADKK